MSVVYTTALFKFFILYKITISKILIYNHVA